MNDTAKYTIIQALSETDGRATLNVGGKVTPIHVTSIDTNYDGVSIEADILTPAPKRGGISYAFELDKIDISREARWLKKFTESRLLPSINKVVFNPPATIVMWSDGTKTVVKAQDEDFDAEKGLAMAISKKALGNKGNYCNEIKKWTEKYEPVEDDFVTPLYVPKEYTFTLSPESASVDLGKIGGNPVKKMSFTVEAVEVDGEEYPLYKQYNPVQKAYDIMVDYRDGDSGSFDLDELIGYLGEALDD